MRMRMRLLHHLHLVHLLLMHLDHLLLGLGQIVGQLVRMHLVVLVLHLMLHLELVLRKRMAVFIHDEPGVV